MHASGKRIDGKSGHDSMDSERNTHSRSDFRKSLHFHGVLDELS